MRERENEMRVSEIKKIAEGRTITKLVVLDLNEMAGTWTYTLVNGKYVDLDNEPELDENHHSLGWMARMNQILEIHTEAGKIWEGEFIPE